MKLISTLALTILIASAAQSQIVKIDSTTHWKKNLNFGINLNQASFSSNWKAGGVNSIGLNTLFNYKANYKKDVHSWDNEIDLLFGFVNNEGQGYRKTLDRIYLDTKYGRDINDKWGLFSSLSFTSQFTKGYKYNDDDTKDLISDIFAPAFITSAWGVEYHPVDYFKVRLAPFAPRFTIVKDPTRFITTVSPTPYGVEPPDETRVEVLAFQMLAEFNKDIAENINLKWRYVMFANYETLEGKKIDHRLDLNLTAKVNKFINVGLGGILLYDYDQDTSVQLSQLMTIGFAYTFKNFEEKK
ncbi:MAG: DUF3078 domain-containing protein [Cyclobacteriaceae bacterium]|nr:DUF3078 domain-containing protein [Cyclobacteriaceae bacterium]